MCGAPDHLLDDFDCGNTSLGNWLIHHARQAQASGWAKTFVVTDGPIPVVLLARLAVDRTYQGRGIGVGMLQDVIRRTLLIAGQAGIRALQTHPIDADADAFYRHFGFVPSPKREGQLLLLLKNARRVF